MRKSLFLILIEISFVAVVLLWGCSPKTLSVFFDGVPNPADSASLNSDHPEYLANQDNLSKAASKENRQMYFFHMPYQDKECASCHNPDIMGKLVETLPALCYQCHEDFGSMYANLHAPVEAGECLSCHNPHMAENKQLLKITGQKMCFECHDSESILSAEYHSEIADADCTDCHNPHGSADKFLLN